MGAGQAPDEACAGAGPVGFGLGVSERTRYVDSLRTLFAVAVFIVAEIATQRLYEALGRRIAVRPRARYRYCSAKRINLPFEAQLGIGGVCVYRRIHPPLENVGGARVTLRAASPAQPRARQWVAKNGGGEVEAPEVNAQVGSRLDGRIAIVVGAGQTPGQTIGNGRATAIAYAREGAQVLVVDRDGDSAAETAAQIVDRGGVAEPLAVDATSTVGCEAMRDACLARFGVPSILHNNVGIGAGDAGITGIGEDEWDHIMAVNLKSVLLPCKFIVR